MLKILESRNNYTVLQISGGAILFSYRIPVAAIIIEDTCTLAYKIDTFFSKTTSRHINRFFGENFISPNSIELRPQDFFEGLVK